MARPTGFEPMTTKICSLGILLTLNLSSIQIAQEIVNSLWFPAPAPKKGP